MIWTLGIIAAIATVIVIVLWIGVKAEIAMRYLEDELNHRYYRGK